MEQQLINSYIESRDNFEKVRNDVEKIKPRLIDLENISCLWERFIRAKKHFLLRKDRLYFQVFVLIILDLYFPQYAIINSIRLIPLSLRKEIAKVLNINRMQTISVLIRESTRKVNLIGTFKSDYEYFSAEILTFIEAEKLK